MRRTRRLIASMTVMIAALGGCTGENLREEPATPTGDALPLLPHVIGLQAQFDALVSGTLVEKQGCLFLEYENGTPLLLIWPGGFEPMQTNDGLVVIDAGGTVFAEVGQPVTLGGGQLPAKHVGQFSEPDATGRCGASKYWLVSSTAVEPDAG